MYIHIHMHKLCECDSGLALSRSLLCVRNAHHAIRFILAHTGPMLQLP